MQRAIFLSLGSIGTATRALGALITLRVGSVCEPYSRHHTWHWVTHGCRSSLLGLSSSDLSSLPIMQSREGILSLGRPLTNENICSSLFSSCFFLMSLQVFLALFPCVFVSIRHKHTCTELNYLSDTLHSSNFLPPSGRSCPLQWQTWLLKNIISYQAREVRGRQKLSGSDGWASF